jgi:hypothetical protein
MNMSVLGLSVSMYSVYDRTLKKEVHKFIIMSIRYLGSITQTLLTVD